MQDLFGRFRVKRRFVSRRIVSFEIFSCKLNSQLFVSHLETSFLYTWPWRGPVPGLYGRMAGNARTGDTACILVRIEDMNLSDEKITGTREILGEAVQRLRDLLEL